MRPLMGKGALNRKYACFFHYLKIITTFFLKNDISSLSELSKELKLEF